MKKVLFVCTHNSARSQMAEAFLNQMQPEKYKAYSAGTKPTKLSPYAVTVMSEIGIDISLQFSKSIESLKGQRFDIVVTVCDSAKESCPSLPEGGKVMHESFDDPSDFRGTDQDKLRGYRRVRDEIKRWVAKEFGEKR